MYLQTNGYHFYYWLPCMQLCFSQRNAEIFQLPTTTTVNKCSKWQVQTEILWLILPLWNWDIGLITSCSWLIVHFRKCKLCISSIHIRIIILIIIHCTHYKHYDWPRAPCLFWEFTWFCGQAWLYSIVCYVVRMRNTPLAKEREHLNGFE